MWIGIPNAFIHKKLIFDVIKRTTQMKLSVFQSVVSL